MYGRARYIVPCITPSQKYVTEYEGIDIAIGFENEEEVKKYLAVDNLNYDMLFFDIDSHEAYIKTKDVLYLGRMQALDFVLKGLETMNGDMEDYVE